MKDLLGKEFGRYQIVEAIGHGGMATVYKAFQPDMERFVAFKVMNTNHTDDPLFAYRFRQEVTTLAKLQHAHIVPIYDYGMIDEHIFFVMPVVEGGDLSDLMEQKKTLSWTHIGQLFSQIGEALHYAHTKGIVHRDVKPSNIFIDQQGNGLLGDFGLSKIGDNDSKLTATGLVMGSSEYMAPEQGLGKEVDARSDVYSLGVVLYELVTGRTPFAGGAWSAIIMKAISEPIVPPSTLAADVPPAIEQIILRACAKEPENRFATAGEMVVAIQDAVAGLSGIMMAIPKVAKPKVESQPEDFSDDFPSLSSTGKQFSLADLEKEMPAFSSTNSGRITFSQTVPPDTSTSTRWKRSTIILLVLLIVTISSFVWMQNTEPEPTPSPPNGPPRDGPPPDRPPRDINGPAPIQAIEACIDISDGGFCSFNDQTRVIEGVCMINPVGEFACMPPELFEPPPTE